MIRISLLENMEKSRPAGGVKALRPLAIKQIVHVSGDIASGITLFTRRARVSVSFLCLPEEFRRAVEVRGLRMMALGPSGFLQTAAGPPPAAGPGAA